jgi:hypothetical protein
LRLIPIFLISVLFALIFPLYSAYSQSTDNENDDNANKVKKEDVKCDNDQKLKDGKCVPKCSKNEESNGDKCVPKCSKNEESNGDKCVPKCSKNEESNGDKCVPNTGSITSLKLNPISSAEGGKLRVEGVLSSDSTKGDLSEKHIIFSGSGAKNLRDTKTVEGGKFRIIGNAPSKAGVWEVQAHFGGDAEYKASDTKVEDYEIKSVQYGAITELSIESTLSVNAEGLVTVQGSLENGGGDGGVEGKQITISGSGVTKDLQDKSKDIQTGPDGKFTITGKAMEKVGEWEVQAHFGGDDEYKPSDSNVGHYTIVDGPVVSAKTYLKLDPISDVVVGASLTVKGELGLLNDGGKGDGLKRKQITFTTTGPNILGSAMTDNNGVFSVTGKAPSKEGNWKVQAQFSGDNDYASSNDTKTYSTTANIYRIEAGNIIVQQVADESELVKTQHTKMGIKLPINARELREWGCSLKGFDSPNDGLKEISPQGSDALNYKIKNKGISKTIDFTIKFNCEENLAKNITSAKILEQFNLWYKTPLKTPGG